MRLNQANMRGKAAEWLPLLALLTYFGLSIALILNSSSTFDSGDSLMHYEFARWVGPHPLNLLDHWAKPVFTLLAHPFTHFGFLGIQVMQCLLVLLIGWANLGTAKRLGLRWPWLASLVALASPMLFLMQGSGLTEPMFAAFLALGVMLAVKDRHLGAALLLSFLPFVRTEGFLLLPAFFLWFLSQRKWLAGLALGAGTFVYMIVGGIVFGDLLWIWTKNPYAGLGNYGSGSLGHFFEKFVYVVGVPGYALIGLGLLACIVAAILGKLQNRMKWRLLVMAPFAIYFGAHVVFWATGTGHSMGLHRVLVAVVPMAALLAAGGTDFLLKRIPAGISWMRPALLAIASLYLLAFPFTKNNAAFHPKDFKLSPDQVLLEQADDFIRAQGLRERTIYAAHPGVAFHLDLDPFDSTRLRSIEDLQQGKPPVGTLLIWDNWFAKLEGGVPEVFWQDNAKDFRELQTWHSEQGSQQYDLKLYESY